MAATTEIHKYGTDDGWHGVIESGGQFPPEKDRYHLYIGLFCPFAHRVNLIRHLYNLTSILPLSIVRPYPKDGGGWRFPTTSSNSDPNNHEHDEYPGATVDHLFGSAFMSEVYFRDDKEYKGKYSVPLLWDKKLSKIVCNESAEMVRWLPTAFARVVELPLSSSPSLLSLGTKPLDLYPQDLQVKIEEIRSWLIPTINIGVYKAGFARTQESYSTACLQLFAALNKLEQLVYEHGGPFILGSRLTELDILAFPTLVRFDVVYVQHFKTNLGMIRDAYPVLGNWLRGVYWGVEGFKESTEFRHIKENYTKSHGDINPLAITPLGPWPDIEEGFEKDWSKLRPGKVEHPRVLEVQKSML